MEPLSTSATRVSAPAALMTRMLEPAMWDLAGPAAPRAGGMRGPGGLRSRPRRPWWSRARRVDDRARDHVRILHAAPRCRLGGPARAFKCSGVEIARSARRTRDLAFARGPLAAD